ncbi:MAG: CDP-diacylglycerol--serine O-phosphatidyltransferase [Deltaproteobacteria bacterium]|jgi:CDP-diacylglycerol--serine O-phosphatidyltransferase|nr:CDP-diacylglycerol--serine O-phosphatidyltransferase [Deltaproteobacteria bacterium]
MTTDPTTRSQESAPEGKRRRRRRRRPRSGPPSRAVALLPQLFTTGNLAAGFWSITLAARGDLDRAALAIFIAWIFDVLDGRVARLTRATSRFGAEYDSIADTVSFGVAPAMLAYQAGALQQLGWTGWVVAFVYAVCAALRLARFNVTPARYQGRFDGLASPSAAGMVLSSVWFAGFLRESGLPLDLPAALSGIGIALLGVLMVSPIPYRSFKDLRIDASHPSSTVLMVLGLIVILVEPRVTLFLLGIVYVAWGPIEWIWRWRTGNALEEIQPEAEGVPSSGEASHE